MRSWQAHATAVEDVIADPDRTSGGNRIDDLAREFRRTGLPALERDREQVYVALAVCGHTGNRIARWCAAHPDGRDTYENRDITRFWERLAEQLVEDQHNM